MSKEEKVIAYVEKNYKSHAGKELIIEFINDNLISIKKHINGNSLFLSSKILD